MEPRPIYICRPSAPPAEPTFSLDLDTLRDLAETAGATTCVTLYDVTQPTLTFTDRQGIHAGSIQIANAGVLLLIHFAGRIPEPTPANPRIWSSTHATD